MDNPNPILYSDLIKPDTSITDLISQLNDLIDTYTKAQKEIQSEAAKTAQSLQGVSGATEEQRKAIQLATAESEKLTEEFKDNEKTLQHLNDRMGAGREAVREFTRIQKLLIQVNNEAEGSYNKLSAQYRLNKIRLNEMSLAERQGTEAGRALEKETNAIYQEMKRLQEATGKHQLNVGNYADAAKGLKQELMSLTQQMAYLKTQGMASSDEYQQMAQRAGQLKDAMMDANREVQAMASDTAQLNAIAGAASAASGGLAAVTGTIALMGASSEDASKAQKTLGSAIAVVSGLTAVQNALQKESNLMTGISTLQAKAHTKATQLDAAAKAKDTAATWAATIAQKAFNLVASANPYVLLAVALVTVVGALAAFALGSNKAAKEQEELNKTMAAQLEYMEQLAAAQTRLNEERIKTLQDELEVAKARNASLQETRKIEDEIYNERIKAHDKQMAIYADELAGLESNRKKVESIQKALAKLKQMQAEGKTRVRVDIDLDGKVEKVKIDEAIEALQGQLDNYGKKVQIATELKTEGADIEKERAVELAKRQEEARQAAKTERDILRETQNARLALIGDGYKRESEQLRKNAQRQIEDIKTRLETEKNLTTKARQALNEQMRLINAKYQQDLEDLQNQYMARDLAARRETEDAQIALMAEGAEKQRRVLETSYQRRIEDLTTAIATRRDLTETETAEMYEQLVLLGEQYRKDLLKLNEQITTDELNADAKRLQLQIEATRENSQERIDLSLQLLEKQREIELAENAKLSENVRQKDADINAKWDEVILQQTAKMHTERALMLFDQQQELAATEFDLLDKNERQKTQFKLEQEKARLQEILRLDKEFGNLMTEQEREAIKNTIDAIDKERGKIPYNNLYELLGIGLDDQQQEALNTALSSIKESIDSIVDSWNEAADAAVNAADKQVEAAQKTLDAELAAREKGYANDVATAQKELNLAKKNQADALKEKEKAQKAQLALDSVQQASSLVTASANLWASLSPITPIGPALAIAAIAAMWTSFAAAKIKAWQVAGQTESYGEGTVELLQGGSHASGHDIDMGTTRDGKRRRAEGGEFFAIINKRNSRKFRRVIPDVINSLNDGTFADRYTKANAAMAGYAVGMIGGGTDVSAIEKDVSAIRKQGDESRFVDSEGNTIIRYKNLTRKIKS